MKPMKVDAAPGQDIFREAISPMASDRPFPLDAMAESHVCKACERTRKEQDLSLRLRDMGDLELDILYSTQARLLMGQGQYGKFEEIDPRNLPKEALEEVQDALVYVAKRLGELGR